MKLQGQNQGESNEDSDHAQHGAKVDAAGDQKPSTTTKGCIRPQQQGSCKPGSSRWRQRVADPTCAYFLSDEFKSSAQLAAGAFLAGLFVFVRELRFSLSYLLGVGTVVGLVRTSSGITAGARIQGAALLIMCTWGILAGSTLITIARQTHAYPTWLSILSAFWLAYVSIIRTLSGTTGYLVALLSTIMILEGQFAWPAGVLWGEATWGIVRAFWASGAITILVGCLVFPKSARESLALGVASHFEFAGQALSAVASNLMPPSSQSAMKITAAGKGDQDEEAEGEVYKQPSMQAYRVNRVDPKADHNLRYTQSSETKQTAELVPAILKTKQLLKLAPSEPAWYGSCRVELGDWKAILAELDIFANLIAALESHLEGHEPRLLEHELEQAFDINPLPCFRHALAVAAASAASMAGAAYSAAASGIPAPVTVARSHKDAVQQEVRITLRQCHEAWQRRKRLPENTQVGSRLLDTPFENRMMMVLRTQSLGLLEASCKLEALLQEAVEKRRRYWWFSRRQPSPATSAEPPSDMETGVSKAEVNAGKPRKGRSIWARLKLEAEPFVDFLEVCAGKPFAETSITLFKTTLADRFGSWEKTKKTLRENRYFDFGIIFFVGSTASLVSMEQASQHSGIIRKWHSFYLVASLVSTLQERVDYALVRGAFRLAMTALASVIGYVIMLRPRLADNTYGLMALTCALLFLAGHFFVGSYKYGSFMASIAVTSMIFNQYSPVPGSHGSVQYFVARVCEYAIGISLAWIIQFLFPWFLAADALEQLGGVAEASAELVCQHVEAYLKDLRYMAEHDNIKADSSDPDVGAPGADEKARISHAAKGNKIVATDDKPAKWGCCHGLPAWLRHHCGFKRQKQGGRKDAAAAARPDAISALSIKDITSKVADQIGAVRLEIAREGVVWKKGPLTLPDTVKASIKHLQAVLERTLAVHLAVKQNACVEGGFTSAPYTTLFQPLEDEMKVYLVHLRRLGRTIKQALAEKAGLSDLHAVSSALEEVESTRVVIHKLLRDVRLQNRTTEPDSLEAKQCNLLEPTADDAYRALGTLIATGRFTDKLVLFGKAVAKDPWLERRGPRRWLHRNAVYF